MVKSVVGDEAQLKSAEDRLFRSSLTTEVGLVVGKLNPHVERGFVYDLIPTPPTDGGGPACSLKSDGEGGEDRKKGSRGGKLPAGVNPPILIDQEWVVEHARQVSRMLLGGMSVVGIYIWSPEASFKATSASIFSQVIAGVAQATFGFESDINERLLIHISYSPRRWACRLCAVTSLDLRPCDFKMSRLLGLLQRYRCMYGFDIRVPIFQDEFSTLSNLKDVIRNRISYHAKELQNARALLDGKLVNEDQQVTSKGLHDVELLLPFRSYVHKEGSSDEVAGLLVLRGAICSYAYTGPKELATQAISYLKSDIINSLRSRLDIALDEVEDNSDMTSNDIGKVNGEMLIGKHLQSENFEDLKDRCREMMCLETPAESSALLGLEAEAVVASTIPSFRDAVRENLTLYCGEPRKREPSAGKRPSGRSEFRLQLALLVLLTAVLAGAAVTAFNRGKAGN